MAKFNAKPVARHLNVLLRVTFVSSVVFRVSAIKCESPDWLTTVRSRKVVSRGGQSLSNQQSNVLKSGTFPKNHISIWRCHKEHEEPVSQGLRPFSDPLIPLGLDFSTIPNSPRLVDLKTKFWSHNFSQKRNEQFFFILMTQKYLKLEIKIQVSSISESSG